MNEQYNPKLRTNARKLRNAMTKEERHLWYDFLRNYPIRFLRQKVIDNYIVGSLHIKQLVIGYNHHFGHDKQGSHSFLVEHGGLEVVEVEQYTAGGNKISSTTIRHALLQGNVALATEMLGHPYIIIGKTDDEGRVAVDRYKLLPADGIYDCTICGKASQCEVRGGELFQQDYFSQEIEIEL